MPAVLPSEVLAELARVTGTLPDPETLYGVLYQQARRLVSLDAFYLALLDETHGQLHFVAHHDRDQPHPAQVMPLGAGPTSWAVRERRSYVYNEGGDLLRGAARRFGSADRSVSAIHAPMLLGDRVVGVLSTQSYHAGAYDAEAVSLIEALAAHGAIALEAVRVAHESRAAAVSAEAALRASRVLRELTRDLAGMETLDSVVERGLEAGQQLLGGDGAMLAGRVHERSDALVVLGAAGGERRVAHVGDPLAEGSLHAAVARTGLIRVSANLDTEPETAADPFRTRVARAGVVVPMRVGAVVTGALTVSASGAESWRAPGEDERLFLLAVADQVAAAINGLRLRGELLTRLEQIDALGRVAHALTGVEDARRTMEIVAEEGTRVCQAQRAEVFLLDRESGVVSSMASFGLSYGYVRAMEQEFSTLPVAAALRGGRPVFLGNATRALGALGPKVAAEGVVSVALLPLIFAGETIGVLGFHHDRFREYSAEERRLAVAFSDQAALAIGKSRLLEQVSRVKREWQSAFDAAGSGMAIVTDDGAIVRGNRWVAELAGVPLTRLPGVPLQTLFRRWPAPAHDPLLRAAQAGGAVTALLDGPPDRLLVVTANPLPDGGLVVALDDVTDVVRLEQRFRLLVETAHDAIVLTDAQGEMAFANPAAQALFGVAEADLLHRPLTQIMPRARPAPEGAHRFEAQLLRPDGSVRMVAVSSAALGSAGGGGTVAVMRDVTTEREATTALRRSEARYRALFANAPLAIVTLRSDGRFLSVNRAAMAMAGVSNERQARALRDFLLPAERDYVEGELRRSFAGAQREFTCHLRRSDGVVRDTAVVVVPLEEAEMRAVLAIIRDVTDEQALRDQLAHSEKMAALGQLVSGVAHELNNPLAGISALAQSLILRRPQDDEPGAELDEGTFRVLETIRETSGRAGRIVNDMLTFARQRPLQRRDTDLNALVRDVLATDLAGLPTPAVAWDLALLDPLPVVSIDPDQIRQVISNLVANARHAMATTPEAEGRIRTWATDQLIGCEVCDMGPGVPPETMARIFEPFFTTKGVGEGTGLGLSLSHGIVRAHGGEIRAENRPEGGARFWFELPRRPGRRSR